MAVTLILVKNTDRWKNAVSPHLTPVDRFSFDELAKITDGVDVKVKITRARNTKFHRLFFALLNVVYENQQQYASIEGLLDTLKMAVGHCDERRAVTGTVFYVPRSISFDNMDETEFREFAKKVIDVIITRIIPGVNSADFEQSVYDILGEPGPASLERQANEPK